MLLVNGILTVPPPQIVVVEVFVMVGLGFTNTVMVCGVPGQLPKTEVGVTV